MRVRNLRYQLQEHQRQLRPETLVAIPTAVALSQPVLLTASVHDLPELPGVLKRVASQLADQRWLLLDHWARFIEIQESWQRERTVVLTDIEEMGRHLVDRARLLDARESGLEQLESEFRQRLEAVARSRAELENWQTRLTLREVTWESQRTAYLTDIDSREQAAAALVQQLETVRGRRQERRRKEIGQFRHAVEQCATVRQEYLLLMRRYEERQAALAQEQRALAARTVAVERYRLELLHQSPDSPAAEKRLEKLRRRSSARIEAGEHKVTAQRQILLAETRRLEERARELQRQDDELTALREELARRETELEQRQIARSATELPRDQQVRLLKVQHEHDARQLTTLRDEVERVARLLLDDAPADSRNQAA